MRLQLLPFFAAPLIWRLSRLMKSSDFWIKCFQLDCPLLSVPCADTIGLIYWVQQNKENIPGHGLKKQNKTKNLCLIKVQSKWVGEGFPESAVVLYVCPTLGHYTKITLPRKICVAISAEMVFLLIQGEDFQGVPLLSVCQFTAFWLSLVN